MFNRWILTLLSRPLPPQEGLIETILSALQNYTIAAEALFEILQESFPAKKIVREPNNLHLVSDVYTHWVSAAQNWLQLQKCAKIRTEYFSISTEYSYEEMRAKISYLTEFLKEKALTLLEELAKVLCCHAMIALEKHSAMLIPKTHVSIYLDVSKVAHVVHKIPDENQMDELTISYDCLCKLKSLYILHSANKMHAFEYALYALLRRYKTFFGYCPYEIPFEEALLDPAFRLLLKNDVNFECFASPLNCYLPQFCSLFLDTDHLFGSYGSFFNWEPPPEDGTFEVSPPCINQVAKCTYNRIVSLRTSHLNSHFIAFMPEGICDDYMVVTHFKAFEYLALVGAQHYKTASYQVSSTNLDVMMLPKEGNWQKLGKKLCSAVDVYAYPTCPTTILPRVTTVSRKHPNLT